MVSRVEQMVTPSLPPLWRQVAPGGSESWAQPPQSLSSPAPMQVAVPAAQAQRPSPQLPQGVPGVPGRSEQPPQLLGREPPEQES